MLNKFFIIPKCLCIFFMVVQSYTCLAQPYDAELINKQTIIQASENKLVETHFFEIKINNRAGDKYSEITIPFDKMNKVSAIEATVTDNLGIEVQKLKKSDIVERSLRSAISFYDDTYVKEFTLRNHTYPYTLKYSYRTEASQFWIITNWFPEIAYKIPTRQATLKLSVPSGYRINYHSNLVGKPTIDSVQGRVTYSWQTSYNNTLTPESWSPPMQQYVPYVEIVPENFRYVLDGSNKSWKSFGDWNLGLLSGLDDLPLNEKLRIHSLTDTIRDVKEKIRTLFHHLQDETRYIDVSIKTGGMKPYPASYVAENKYGDCKALSNYFKSCLSVIGVNAFYTAINAGDEYKAVDTAFPAQQFNHVILFIPLNQDTLWVDCTSNYAFGYLGTFTQNRPALVMDNKASALIRTPRLEFEDIPENRKIKAEVSTEGVMKADFIYTCKGEKYELLSNLKSELSETHRLQFLNNNMIPFRFQLDTYSIVSPGRDQPETILNFTASSDQMMKEYGNESLLKIIALGFLYLEEPKKRKLPVRIDYPVYRNDTSTYTIPLIYRISGIPADILLKSKYGDYKVRFTSEGNMVKAIKQLKIKSGYYPLDEYQDFYNFMNQIFESENSLYITLIKI